MPIENRKSGDLIHLASDISVTVLEIDRCEVKLGICNRTSRRDHATANEQLASVQGNGSRYFLFPQGGQCTLVVRCESGKSVSFNGSSTLTVLAIAKGVATLRLTPAPQIRSATRPQVSAEASGR